MATPRALLRARKELADALLAGSCMRMCATQSTALQHPRVAHARERARVRSVVSLLLRHRSCVVTRNLQEASHVAAASSQQPKQQQQLRSKINEVKKKQKGYSRPRATETATASAAAAGKGASKVVESSIKGPAEEREGQLKVGWGWGQWSAGLSAGAHVRCAVFRAAPK